VAAVMLTVRLDKKTQARLTQLARATGQSQSAIVREALRRYTPPVEATRTVFDRFADVIGIAHLGAGDRARRSEEILRRRFARPRHRQ
jgi:predicted transcriptional regulator